MKQRLPSARLSCLAACGAVLLVAGCERRPPPPPVVAQVGEETLTLPELEAAVKRVLSDSEAEPSQVGDEPALTRAVLDQLIERRLLLVEARRRGISVSDAEVEQALLRRRAARLPVRPSEAVEAAGEPPGAEAGGAEPEMPPAAVREQLLVDKLLLNEVVARVALGPDDARTYYEAHAEEFRRGEQVRVQQIAVRSKDEAESLRRELLRGADFSELARRHSLSPDAQAGGDLGFFGQGTMPPEFDEACFRLRKGQVSEVVESPYGFHVFRLIDRRDPAPIPFAQVEGSIELRLKREAVARAQGEYLDKLRAQAGVRVFEEVLATAVAGAR